MKSVSKLLAGIALATTVASSVHAINVGGVIWNPSAVNISDSDFTGRYEFNQFFTTPANAVANVLNAQANYGNAISPATVVVGDVLQGVGEVLKFNGVNYGDSASSTGGAFCPTCELTFTFGGFDISSTTPPTLNNGWLRLYVDNSPDFDITSSPAGNAADGVLFLQMTARANQFTNSGTFASGSLFTYYDVVGGLALVNFDTNMELFLTDLLQSASATFSGNNTIATATGQIVGNTIPEPESLALVGLGLLGLGALRRRRVG